MEIWHSQNHKIEKTRHKNCQRKKSTNTNPIYFMSLFFFMIIILAEKNGTIAMIQFHRIYLKCPDVNRIDYIERKKNIVSLNIRFIFAVTRSCCSRKPFQLYSRIEVRLQTICTKRTMCKCLTRVIRTVKS